MEGLQRPAVLNGPSSTKESLVCSEASTTQGTAEFSSCRIVRANSVVMWWWAFGGAGVGGLVGGSELTLENNGHSDRRKCWKLWCHTEARKCATETEVMMEMELGRVLILSQQSTTNGCMKTLFIYTHHIYKKRAGTFCSIVPLTLL